VSRPEGLRYQGREQAPEGLRYERPGTSV